MTNTRKGQKSTAKFMRPGALQIAGGHGGRRKKLSQLGISGRASQIASLNSTRTPIRRDSSLTQLTTDYVIAFTTPTDRASEILSMDNTRLPIGQDSSLPELTPTMLLHSRLKTPLRTRADQASKTSSMDSTRTPRARLINARVDADYVIAFTTRADRASEFSSLDNVKTPIERDSSMLELMPTMLLHSRLKHD
ncbi:hypothetical protein ACFE04_021261 [Oxalis oulophora]